MNVQNYFNYGPRSVDSDSEGSLEDFIVPDDEVVESEASEADSMDLESRYPLRSNKRKRTETKKPALKTTSYFFEIQGTDSIIGRDTEAKTIIGMIQQPLGGMRPLLLGQRGIGKQSIIEKTAYLLKTVYHQAPWGERKIYCLDCDGLMAHFAGESVKEDSSNYLKALAKKVAAIQPLPPVIYFRSIEKLMKEDVVSECVRGILEQPLGFTASIAEDAHDEKIAKVINTLSQYNFFLMPVKESPLEEINTIVKQTLRIQGDHFTEEGVDLAVRLAAKHFTQRPLPARAFNVIQECANAVWMEKEGTAAITPEDVAAFISTKTGIPSEDLLDDSIFNEERFCSRLKDQIIGQEHAVKIVGERVASWKMGLLNPNKPWGVFLFVGPTGVGKTELAKQLAKHLFHKEGNVIILDGSEYKEEHTASNLVGAPRGYEGHDSGGMLTGPLLDNPYQVVLFDEFEKAHADVRNLFLQVFDQGRLTDRRGKIADCTKAIFIMTSNLGAEEVFNDGRWSQFTTDQLTETLMPFLVDRLKPEMCGRFTAIVPFLPIRKENLERLVIVQLHRKRENLLKQTEIYLDWDTSLVTKLTKIDFDSRLGARQFCDKVNAAIEKVLKDAMTLSRQRLKGKVTLYANKKGELTIRVAESK